MSEDVLSFFTVVIAYLLGSIPFGVILTKIFDAGDLRSIGSGNIGATNVLRTGRKGLAAATLIGDMLKGTAAVLVAHYIFGAATALPAAIAAFLGHLFPVWLKFKGGKGVATYLGVTLALVPIAAAAFAVSWLLTARLSRYSSLSALVASLVTPFVAAYFGDVLSGGVLFLLTIVLWVTHRANIKRLMAGTEGRIGAKNGATSEAGSTGGSGTH
ncbi:MAG: glycerol-3-phosphate 1-O-acyltransferase PlsY [Hyphomicrobiales bacterium]